jgi:hypothetical protein
VGGRRHHGQTVLVDVHESQLAIVEASELQQAPDESGNEHAAAAADDRYRRHE